MRYLILTCIVGWLLLIAVAARAQNATLEWEQSPTPGVDGYHVWYQASPYVEGQWNGTGATEGDSPIDVADVLTFDVTGLTDGVVYWFTATAYISAHCSDSQYADQATCEDNSGTWTPYQQSHRSNVVRTGSGGRLYMGGPGRIRLPIGGQNPAGRVSF